jgi:beta-glucanase (GH16 family)
MSSNLAIHIGLVLLALLGNVVNTNARGDPIVITSWESENCLSALESQCRLPTFDQRFRTPSSDKTAAINAQIDPWKTGTHTKRRLSHLLNGYSDREKDSPHVPAGYIKVFSDEFNQVELDTSKWWTRYIYSGGTLDFLNDEQERYREDGNHVMTGQSLILMAKKTNGLDRTSYVSGMIRSKTTFHYGYFEARIKLPGGLGVAPAFWLNSARRLRDGKIAWPPEIDIFEFVINGVEDQANMLHTGVASNGPQGGGVIFSDADFHIDWHYWKATYSFASDFHIFAGLWDTDDTVSIYVDGQMIYKVRYKWVYDDGTPAGYAHLLLNLAIGGNWAGRHGIDDSAFPQGLEVDYVRVYQKIGKRRTGEDAIGQDLCPDPGKC